MKRIPSHLCILLSLILYLTTAAYSLDLSNLVAYPVPFNPQKTASLTIGNRASAGSLPTSKIKVEIFDVNGDLVWKRTVSSGTDLKWNGRNGRGTRVKPGLYIIRVIVEDTTTGDTGKKLIRILVNY